MTALLERRYRSVLRLLPAYYRRAREEEMVETYLYGIDEADQEWMRPAFGEVASVAALAVRSRFGAVGAPPGYAVLGSTARLFAVLGVLLEATTTVTEGVLTLAWADGSAENRALFLSPFRGDAASVAWEVVWRAVPLLWSAGLVALLGDRRRTARVLVTLAAAPTTVWFVESAVRGGGLRPGLALESASAVLACLTAGAVWCGYHADSAPARLPFGPPGLAFFAGCVLMGGAAALWPEGVDTQWAEGAVFVPAGVTYLALRARRRTGAEPGTLTDPSSALAPAALGVLLVALRLSTLGLFVTAGVPTAPLVAAAVETAAVALTAAALATTGTRALTARLRTAPAGP